jgi:hypothetical protein
MKPKQFLVLVAALALLATASAAPAQRFRGFDEPADERWGVPLWEIDEKFKSDVFTFVRVQYNSARDAYRQFDDGFGGRRRRGGRGGGWRTDYPQADLNFSYRLQQLTSFNVNPEPIALPLTDESLFDYPFIYMVEPGSGDLYFTEPEITALRRYLLNGGFMMVDDFWGDWEWDVFYQQIKRVFPDREPVELPIEHEIFRCVYKLTEKPQVPAINSVSPEMYARGITYERNHGPGAETVHFKAILDDKKRIMVLICHNTDIGDGWEREGYDEWYFHAFCENKSYPMGINIVTYAMTH